MCNKLVLSLCFALVLESIDDGFQHVLFSNDRLESLSSWWHFGCYCVELLAAIVQAINHIKFCVTILLQLLLCIMLLLSKELPKVAFYFP